MGIKIAPRPIGTAPIAIGTGEEPITLLLYCPEQDDWLIGAWWRAGTYDGVWLQQGWRWTADPTVELRPTHWLPYCPCAPKGSGVPALPLRGQ